MYYKLGKKTISIPDGDINRFMTKYSVGKEEAIQLWLEDNDFLDNEEVEELTTKAKDNKVLATIHEAKSTKEKAKRTVTKKISDEKKELFTFLKENLAENYENVVVLNENKLISVKIGEKTFKIDLIEQRSPKK